MLSVPQVLVESSRSALHREGFAAHLRTSLLEHFCHPSGQSKPCDC